MDKEFQISASWYSEDWEYRQKITIVGITGAGVDYQVNITIPYDSNMQANFSDIRFTDDDGTTLLDHWRESYTASTTALFWVEVKDDLGTNQYLYMYYGNTTAVTSASNGTATFLFYEDWANQSLDAWTIPINQQDGSTSWSVTDATQGGYVAKIEGDSEDSYILLSDFNYTAPFALRFRANIEDATTGNTARFGTGWAGAYGWAYVQSLGTTGAESFSVYDDDGNPDEQAMTTAYVDSWITFDIRRGLSIAGPLYTKLSADNIDIELASFDPDAIENPVCGIQNIDSECDIYSDWVVCRKFNTIEPYFSSFGSESTYLEWNVINEIELVFSIPLDQTGFNILLVFLGLIMIPSSTIYAAKGGLKEASMDKLFFFLIIFVLGWGLFLGGIM